MDPATFVAGSGVPHQGDFSFSVLVVCGRDKSEVCDHLEAVADAYCEFVFLCEGENLFVDVVFDAV